MNSNKKLLLFCLAVFFVSTGTAFSQLPDSVLVKLRQAVHDTSRIRILVNYAQQAKKDSSVLVVVNEAYKLADKNKASKWKKVFQGYKSDIALAEGYYYENVVGDAVIAVEKYKRALSLADSIQDNSRIENALSDLQNKVILSGNVEEGRKLNDRCIRLQKQLNRKKKLAYSYFARANLFSMEGNFDSSLACFMEVNRIGIAIRDSVIIAESFDAIGISHLNKGDLHLALPQFFNSVKAFEAAGVASQSYSPLMHIGGVYAKLGEYHKALVYYNRALPLLEEENAFNYVCDLYLNMGVAYRFVHENDSAIACQLKALEASRKIGMVIYSVFAHVYLGLNYLDKNDTLKALKYFRESLSENTDSVASGLFESYFQLGDIFLKMDKIDSAFYYAKLASQVAEKRQNMESKKAVFRLLSDLYERKGNTAEALKNYKNYILFRDSIDNKKSFRVALEKQYEYEAEKQELLAKVEQEKKDTEIREQKNKRILTTVGFSLILLMGGSLVFVNRKRKESSFRKNLAESEMKALRAQMNPHFMFNSLNAIQQMVLNNENDNAFHYLDTYSKLTRSILENSEKKWITVQDEIKFLELYLSIESLRFQHSFTYEIKVSEDVSIHSDKLPAVVVQPYVENAIKHGLLPKKENQKLLIGFSKTNEDTLEIIVEDNGVGRKHSQESKTETDHHSMGMTITENRLRLLEGKKENKVWIEDLMLDGLAAGTRVHIVISQA